MCIALLEQATKFITQLYEEQGKTAGELGERVSQIKKSIALTGTYEHTNDELVYGAKIAWRNNAHCIGKVCCMCIPTPNLRISPYYCVFHRYILILVITCLYSTHKGYTHYISLSQFAYYAFCTTSFCITTIIGC